MMLILRAQIVSKVQPFSLYLLYLRGHFRLAFKWTYLLMARELCLKYGYQPSAGTPNIMCPLFLQEKEIQSFSKQMGLETSSQHGLLVYMLGSSVVQHRGTGIMWPL